MLVEYGAEEQCTSKTDFINSLALMLGHSIERAFERKPFQVRL